MTELLHHTFQSYDQIQLYGRSFLSDATSPIGDIIVQHGLGEHSGRYQELAELLNQRDFNVHLLDLRGHGQSEGKRGDAKSIEQLSIDLETFIEYLNSQNFNLNQPLLVGHSLGAAVVTWLTLRHSNQFHLKGIAISGAPFQVAMNFGQQIKQAAGKILVQVAPALTLDSGIDAKYLSHDGRVVDRYLSDPLVHSKLSVQLGLSIVDVGKVLIPQASRLKIPLWTAHGGDDKIADSSGTVQFFKKAGTNEKSLHIYEGFYHEIFNETNRQDPIEDLLGFVEHSFEK